MSYTIPEYVDTKEQAVLAVASAIADEDKSALGNGSVNKALDILADVLAQQDVSVPQTNAGAILALAQYVTGGGGGSSDLTTAKVTFVNQGAADIPAFAPVVFEDGGDADAETDVFIERGTTESTVILYKGTALLSFDASVAASKVDVTGGVEVRINPLSPTYLKGLTITGDGTVTIAA